MTGHWADYSWPPAIVLVSVSMIFLMDFLAEQYVDRKYGFAHAPNVEALITDHPGAHEDARRSLTHTQLHSGDQDPNMHDQIAAAKTTRDRPLPSKKDVQDSDSEKGTPAPSVSQMEERSFREQIAAFLILEFGVIFHSVIIGLNLGVAGDEFSSLYPVIVFHQAFEGLGIGARLSAIPFPARKTRLLQALPWLLCVAYGFTTPISISIGVGLSTRYQAGSFTAQVVSGVLDSISAGILLYTGLVELLARDFLFNPDRSREGKRVTFMLGCLFLGTGIMALLGKWA